MAVVDVAFSSRISVSDFKTALENLLSHVEGAVVKATKEREDFIHVALENSSLRGVEVQFNEENANIFIGRLASKGDYELLKWCVIAFMNTGAVRVVIDTLHVIDSATKAENFKWLEWSDYTRSEESEELFGEILQNGVSEVLGGVFFPVVIGPRVLTEYEHDRDAILTDMVERQWKFKDIPKLQPIKLIEEGTHNSVGLNLLDLGEPLPSEGLMLTYTHALGAGYLSEGKMRVCRFRHAQQIFTEGMPLDEEQLIVYQMEDAMLKETVARASLYAEQNIFNDPVMPGEGYDESSKTFILMWNREISSVKLDDFLYWMENMRGEDSNWSVTDWKEASIGDRWFLVSCAESGKKGIVASGVFDSNPWQGEDWSGKGREVYYCDLLPNVLMNPVDGDLISSDYLKYLMPDFEWGGGSSGRVLGEEYARILEDKWHECLEKWEKDPDAFHVRIMRGE